MKKLEILKQKIFKMSKNQFTLTDNYLNENKYNVYFTCSHKIFKSYNSLREITQDIKDKVFN